MDKPLSLPDTTVIDLDRFGKRSPMKRLNARQVEAFQAVMRLGSMTKAADALGISQPAVSRLLTDLSEAVGFVLFRRHPNGAIPTDDARLLFAEVDRLFIGLDELGHRAHAISKAELGSVRIVTMGPYGSGILPQIIAGFHKKHPRIFVALDIQPQSQLVDHVLSRRCDLGLVTLPVSDSQLTSVQLATRSALCVLPVGHPLTAKDTITPADLAEEPFVDFPRGAPFRYTMDAIFERAGVQRRAVVEGSNHETVCSLVATGMAVSIVSPFSRHLRGNPQLAFRPFSPSLSIDIGLIAREGRMSIPAQTFFDFAVSYFETVDSDAATQPGDAA